jgi:hypothetical protein
MHYLFYIRQRHRRRRLAHRRRHRLQLPDIQLPIMLLDDQLMT